MDGVINELKRTSEYLSNRKNERLKEIKYLEDRISELKEKIVEDDEKIVDYENAIQKLS